MKIKFNNIEISNNSRPIIIAEIGINHLGSLEKAIFLSELALSNGADIIKHQSHIAEEEMSLAAKKIKPPNANKNIFDLIKECSLSFSEEKKLCRHIKSKKGIFISTPFSRKAADNLYKLKIPVYKIGSGECNNFPLVEYIAKKRKPIILSTGMNDIPTIKKSVNILKKYKLTFALLHCVNSYPTPTTAIDLNNIKLMKGIFKNIPIGLSDHTENIYSSIMSMSLGCKIIEKHFTNNKNGKSPDDACSMTPDELKHLRNAAETYGTYKYIPKKIQLIEKDVAKFAFASVTATRNINVGEKFTQKNIFPLRPFNGQYKVKDYKKLIGKTCAKPLVKGEQLSKKNIKY